MFIKNVVPSSYTCLQIRSFPICTLFALQRYNFFLTYASVCIFLYKKDTRRVPSHCKLCIYLLASYFPLLFIGCSMDAQWMLNGCSMDARYNLTSISYQCHRQLKWEKCIGKCKIICIYAFFVVSLHKIYNNLKIIVV